jgi:hypothetical protein
MPIQEIKNVVGLGIGVAELVDSVADGVSLGDVFSVVGVLKSVKPAIDAIKGGKLLDQYASLTQAEKEDLAKWFDAEFDIKNDKVELVVEQVYKAVLELSELASMVKA